MNATAVIINKTLTKMILMPVVLVMMLSFLFPVIGIPVALTFAITAAVMMAIVKGVRHYWKMNRFYSALLLIILAVITSVISVDLIDRSKLLGEQAFGASIFFIGIITAFVVQRTLQRVMDLRKEHQEILCEMIAAVFLFYLLLQNVIGYDFGIQAHDGHFLNGDKYLKVSMGLIAGVFVLVKLYVKAITVDEKLKSQPSTTNQDSSKS